MLSMMDERVSGLPRAAVFILFEAGLGLLGLGLGWWLFHGFGFLAWRMDGPAVGRAALWTLPMAVAAVLAASDLAKRLPLVSRIRADILDSPIGDFIRDASIPAFAALSIAAGFSEELFFRAVLQPKLGIWLGALLFGALHAMSWAYFLFAAGVGLYLGWAFDAAGGNLAVPALMHAAYDFTALILFRAVMRRETGPTGP